MAVECKDCKPKPKKPFLHEHIRTSLFANHYDFFHIIYGKNMKLTKEFCNIARMVKEKFVTIYNKLDEIESFDETNFAKTRKEMGVLLKEFTKLY